MDQFEVMSELYSDRSNWVDVRHYPSTVTCRRMLRLADFAAADPARWSSCRMAFEVPELSYRELAVARGVSHTTIMRHLEPVELDRESPTGRTSQTGPTGPTCRTFRYASALCTFAAAQPERWRVLRLAYECPELSQEELAEVAGVSQPTVCRYLQPVQLEVDESFNDLEVIY